MNITLPREGAARAARRLVAQCCSEAGAGPDLASSVALLTSEVVTNALLHGRGLVRLSFSADRTRVRVEVGDDDPAHPRVPEQLGGAESGRGMLIVAALASDWGVVDVPGGKVVWFELVAQP